LSLIRRIASVLSRVVRDIAAFLGGRGRDPVRAEPGGGPPSAPTRVAILGGGCGSIATAFALTSTPELRERYAITVYQQGWRLGGKGASGRDVAPGHGLRIEEHGLHMWMGFYENAFRAMEACYGEWQKQPDNPFQTWEQAFTAQNLINLMERREVDGITTWDPWTLDFTGIECGTPGKPLTARDVLRCLFGLFLHHHGKHPALGPGTPGHDALERAREHLVAAPADHDPAELSVALLAHLEPGHAHVREATAAAAPGARDAGGLDLDLRRLWLMLNLGWAMLKGFVEDVLPHGGDGYLRIDDQDFRAWLVSHGARPDYTDAAPIRALYDLGFAYMDGDTTKPAAAAGVVLRVILGMMFGDRGAPLWRMNAGMGDTVFTPFYEVLRARGVRFAFFHRVLGIDADGSRVTSIQVARQVDLKPDYRLLIPVRGLPCWPSEPDWDNIVDGAAIRDRLAAEGLTLESHWCQQRVGPPETLEVGRDFDVVVCGISVAALEGIAMPLMKANSAFGAMVEGLGTVATQSLQLWVNEDLDGLGWTHGAVVSTAFAEPWASWAVMSHLIPMEDWPEGNQPAGIHYFCGPLSLPKGTPPPGDHTFPRQIFGQVQRNATGWLGDNVGVLWPRAFVGNGFNVNWKVLYDPTDEITPDRFAFQFWRANVDPTERYVLSLPGTAKLRLDPGDSGFANLYLAGDWTLTRLNAGSVEAAIESGLRAARAISGAPIDIAHEHGIL
jgi:uncharacterized protein with NAD-binding domain and iron-sulfur cluster